MYLIQIPLEHWIEANEELLKVGTTSRSTLEPIYVVTQSQMERLEQKQIPFERLSREEWKRVWEEERALSVEQRHQKGQALLKKAIEAQQAAKES